MILDGTFTGVDGANGYEHGKTYRIKVIGGGGALKVARFADDDEIQIVQNSAIPYQSFFALMNDWKNLSKVNPNEPKRNVPKM